MGNERVRKPNIMGIIHNIIVLVCACLGSVEGVAIIFCWTHVVAPTRIGSHNCVCSWAEPARSIHRNLVSMGIASFTRGSQL